MRALAIALALLATPALAQRLPTAQEALAIRKPFLDCLWTSVGRYDDGKGSVNALADRVLGICSSERAKERQAFHFPINDPVLDLGDFKLAVEAIDYHRKRSSH